MLSRNVRCVMQTHQDQLFFEAVYSTLAAIIHEALGSFKTRQQIDVEVCTHWLAITALCLKQQRSFDAPELETEFCCGTTGLSYCR